MWSRRLVPLVIFPILISYLWAVIYLTWLNTTCEFGLFSCRYLRYTVRQWCKMWASKQKTLSTAGYKTEKSAFRAMVFLLVNSFSVHTCALVGLRAESSLHYRRARKSMAGLCLHLYGFLPQLGLFLLSATSMVISTITNLIHAAYKHASFLAFIGPLPLSVRLNHDYAIRLYGHLQLINDCCNGDPCRFRKWFLRKL